MPIFSQCAASSVLMTPAGCDDVVSSSVFSVLYGSGESQMLYRFTFAPDEALNTILHP